MSRLKEKLRDKQGSIVLELAIALPLFLIAAWFMISATLAHKQALILRHALDQTASELEVMIPLVEGAGNLTVGDAKMAAFMDKLFPDDPNILQSAALDIASSELLQHFLNERIDHWVRLGTEDLKLRLPAHDRSCLLLWQPDGKSLEIRLRHELTTPWTRHPQTVSALVPLWLTTPAHESEADDKDNIWSASNFQRGRYFRDLYGANLPFNTPVIAYYGNGKAMAIRSMDLTAPSYTDVAKGRQQVRYEINRLAKFTGCKVPGQDLRITPGMLHLKELLLVVPENTPAAYDAAFWAALKTEAEAKGVTLIVTQKWQSHRYEGTDENAE